MSKAEWSAAILGRGVRSKRLAHTVGRMAADMGLLLDETIPWLRMLHIAGWINEFDATPREIEDLADLTRDASATSLLRQLLSSAEATATLHQPMDLYPPSEIPVSLRTDGPAEPIEVWTVGEASYMIGLVAAEHHADYIALIEEGLSFSVRAKGGVLVIRADS